MTRNCTLIFCLTTLFGLSVAHAQETEAPAAGPPAAQSAAPASFTGLDRVDGYSRAGFRTSYVVSDDDLFTAFGFELYGQYAARLGNDATVGGYGHLPFSFITVDAPGVDSEFSIANLEAGGFYTMSLGETVKLVVRGGLSLPTAEDELIGRTGNAIAAMARISRVVGTVPDTTWLRIGVSPIIQRGIILVRADIGVDVPIDEPSSADSDTFVNLNAGVGVSLKNTTLLLELLTVGILSNKRDLEFSDRFVHTVGGGVEFDLGQLRVRAALVIPLDKNLGDLFDVALVAGIEGVFGE